MPRRLGYTLPSMMQVYPSCQVQIGLLLADKGPIEIPSKYLDYTNVFSFDLARELRENTCMNKHAIELVACKQPNQQPRASGAEDLKNLH